MDHRRLHAAAAPCNVPLNSTEFAQRLRAEAARVNRYGGELGFILFSLDDLDGLYARLGSRSGDDLLDHLTTLMARRIRAHDLLARRNKGEYAVLVPEMELTEVTGFAVKLRRLVDEYQFNDAGVMSASFGVTEFRRGEPVDALEQRAQRAMERARAAGGNRISAARAGE